MPRAYDTKDLILDLLYIPTHISEILNRIYNMSTGQINYKWIEANVKSYRILTMLRILKQKNKVSLGDAIQLAFDIYEELYEK